MILETSTSFPVGVAADAVEAPGIGVTDAGAIGGDNELAAGIAAELVTGVDDELPTGVADPFGSLGEGEATGEAGASRAGAGL